jgi:hypothetical protein
MTTNRPKPSGWFALGDDDPDMEGVEREIVTSSGEIVTLAPWVALMRHNALIYRENRRLAYCKKTGRDPDEFTGCVDCNGTGYGFRQLACHCQQGRSVLREERKQDGMITALLGEKLGEKGWMTGNQDRSDK